MKTFSRIIATICLVTPVATWLWLLFQPEVVLRTADAGVFVTATTAPGGLFSDPLTSVDTSTTSVVVVGAFSGQRGARMLLQDSTREGLALCTQARPRSCAAVAGSYSGPMQQVAPARFHLRGNLRLAVDQLTTLMFLTGIVALIVNSILRMDEEEAERQRRRQFDRGDKSG